jgi:hypothetical protein
MSSRKPWQPRVDTDTELNPFHNGASDRDDPLEIQDAEEDSAPLQGSKDLSDDDSLEDVIADNADKP